LTDFIQIFQMFIIWGNDNLSKIGEGDLTTSWELTRKGRLFIVLGQMHFIQRNQLRLM